MLVAVVVCPSHSTNNRPELAGRRAGQRERPGQHESNTTRDCVYKVLVACSNGTTEQRPPSGGRNGCCGYCTLRNQSTQLSSILSISSVLPFLLAIRGSPSVYGALASAFERSLDGMLMEATSLERPNQRFGRLPMAVGKHGSAPMAAQR